MKILLAVWLFWMSILDCRACSVPKWLLWGGSGLNLIISLWMFAGECNGDVDWVGYLVSVLVGMIPGICLLLISYLTGLMGYGDGIVMTALGGCLGIQKAVLVLSTALFLTAICSVVLLLIRKVRRGSQLPFLPFLTLGWLLVGIAG